MFCPSPPTIPSHFWSATPFANDPDPLLRVVSMIPPMGPSSSLPSMAHVARLLQSAGAE